MLLILLILGIRKGFGLQNLADIVWPRNSVQTNVSAKH